MPAHSRPRISEAPGGGGIAAGGLQQIGAIDRRGADGDAQIARSESGARGVADDEGVSFA